MIFDADMLLDRRRLKASILRWRLLAGIALIIAILVALAKSPIGEGLIGGFGSRIVEVDIEGVITEDPNLIAALDQLADDDKVAAVILHINSPGGTMVGGEELFEALRRVGKKRPIAAEMGTVAASGGYMSAIAADHIVAHRGTVTGSIGVIFQSMNITGTLQKLGVEPITVKSGPLKAVPNPLEPVDDAAKLAMKGLISDMFDVFVGMVAERRKMSIEEVRQLADGRVFTGRQAVKNGLIDEIGGRHEVMRWLHEDAGIASDLPVVPLHVKDADDPLMAGLLKGSLGKVLSSEGLKLDGLLTLWHPE